MTGAGGLLGSEFRSLSKNSAFASYEIVCLGRMDLDITQADSFEKQIERLKPDYLINCAAYTDVEGAELEKEQAWAVNVQGVQNLAEASRRHGIKLIHYSSDYVFDGQKRTPYLESDSPRPINRYGLSKWEGEKAIQSTLPLSQFLILRISWPYGKNGKNFIHQLWDLSKIRKNCGWWRTVGVPNPAPLLATKNHGKCWRPPVSFIYLVPVNAPV